jgi:hypothetical protein
MVAALALGMEKPLPCGVHANTAKITINKTSLYGLPCCLSTFSRVGHPEVGFDSMAAILVQMRAIHLLRRVFALGCSFWSW